MTRVYATCKLLEHGPLTFKEFRIITGWTVPQCRHALALAIKNDHEAAFVTQVRGQDIWQWLKGDAPAIPGEGKE